MYPEKEQKGKINSHLGISRFIYAAATVDDWSLDDVKVK